LVVLPCIDFVSEDLLVGDAAMRRSRHCDASTPSSFRMALHAQARQLAQYGRIRNKHHAKANWQFKTADARVKLNRLYPQFG
jgi:hypothetical protein